MFTKSLIVACALVIDFLKKEAEIMKIFETYSGNAMLNNALMTIEGLAKVNSVADITPEILMQLHAKLGLGRINRRLKSYTMLFTKNGPLHNDSVNGEKIYESLIKTITANFENQGSHICEISGLKFEKTFSDLYQLALKGVGISEKDIKKKDTNIGRTWFPLIGGLGSDAQALPQAKFSVSIHPICIVILQFLPLSAVLYKGGVLLIDSSNFILAREMVIRNSQVLSEKIQSVSVKDPVENVRDFAKGDYLIRALSILTEKEEMEETYSDLNMWSFSNSGTGASCAIDRVPNSLIRKLQRLFKNVKIINELKRILSRNESAYSFIESLEDNKDWFLLYPNVFGSGKKRVEYDGVSPDFLEAYYELIKKDEFLKYAKYVAGLIKKYKSTYFEKLLDKTDAWNNPEYRIELYKVLVVATERGEWSLNHQIQILDNKNQVPIKNHFYQLHKLTHYYFQKKIYSTDIPKAEVADSSVFNACKWIIGLIQKNSRKSKIISDLTNANEYLKVGYDRVVIEALDTESILIENVLETFYDDDFNYSKFGLNELMRIFFSQPMQEEYIIESWESELVKDELIQNWLKNLELFTEDYKSYYHKRYMHSETSALPLNKFARTVQTMISSKKDFYSLLNEAIDNTNKYLNDNKFHNGEKWTSNLLLNNPSGIYSSNISKLAVKFLLKTSIFKR